jgi:uncharacterized membrane-anchored protein YhcB (DUF1043 family)
MLGGWHGCHVCATCRLWRLPSDGPAHPNQRSKLALHKVPPSHVRLCRSTRHCNNPAKPVSADIVVAVPSTRRVPKAVYAPPLPPMGLVAPLVVVAAVVMLAAIFIGLEVLLPGAGAAPQLKRTLEAIKATLLIGAFIGAVLTGLYAYRKQQLEEASELRADAQELRADAQELASRFSRAAEQLGHSSAAVRLAGVLSMASLADEWEAERQLCIHALTTYLQVPYDTKKAVGEREVRRNLIRLIRNHLRDGFSDVSWRGYDFRFEGALFEGGDLSGAKFTGGKITFHAAQFVSDTFHFDKVEFAGGDVWFTNAEFKGGKVSFNDASITAGRLDFSGCTVESGASVTFDRFANGGGKVEEGPFTSQIN